MAREPQRDKKHKLIKKIKHLIKKRAPFSATISLAVFTKAISDQQKANVPS
jgi:hypothetical protein